MLNDLDLMAIQARTLFTADTESRLLLVNEPGLATPAPHFFLGRTPVGNVTRFRADLPERLVRELAALCADDPPLLTASGELPRHAERYVQRLGDYVPVGRVWAGPAYAFSGNTLFPENTLLSGPLVAVSERNREVLEGGFEKLLEELPLWQPFVALIQEGRAVSVCRSVRITAEAHEAGVETLPGYRGRGYARSVAEGWAQQVRSLGALPLYSTSWDNEASRAVARSLGLRLYGADFHVS